MCEGQGNGPVNALDNASRQNVDRLNKYSKYLKDLKLVDYKVRILNTGTEAITRVSIESTDSKGKNWFTIGVSANIIDASFKALVDSLDYKLFKDNAPASLYCRLTISHLSYISLNYQKILELVLELLKTLTLKN